MPAKSFDIPRALRRGGTLGNVEKSVKDTLMHVDIMHRKLGRPDMSQSRVLDMGCGWRMTKTLLDHNIPIAEYVGVDVYAGMIEFLSENVTDPRFSFHTIDAHNEMYNPDGKPLSAVEPPDLREGSFDIICLYSVFTHLAPHDYEAMLKFLRPFVKPEGKLIFSLFVNETTEGGLGFIDALQRGLQRMWEENPDQIDQFQEKFASRYQENTPPPFTDFDPSKPLKWAIYSREYAIELVEGNGWEIESLNDPEEAIPHYMICKPA